MPIGGLYQTPDLSGRALQGYQGAAQTTAAMQKETPEEKKTTEGALSAAAGGAAMGTAVMPGWGTAIGACVGLAMYYM